MAEKSKDKEGATKHHHSGGGMSFGLEVVLFVVVIFIIWLLTGGAKKPQPQSPLLVPSTEQVSPTGDYGQGGN